MLIKNSLIYQTMMTKEQLEKADAQKIKLHLEAYITWMALE